LSASLPVLAEFFSQAHISLTFASIVLVEVELVVVVIVSFEKEDLSTFSIGF
jgi:hypothetical protein